MTIDRALQRALLEKLAAAYPEDADVAPWELPEPATSANLKYLEEHGLIGISAHTGNVCGLPWRAHMARITARGLDFMADDGGLSAILDTVTVRLHADTVRDLLEARIAASSLPPAEKSRLVSHLRSLPAEALKHLTKRLLDEALLRWPEAIALLQRWLDAAAR